MPTQKIQSVYLKTQRMDVLQGFYENALGLTPAFRDGNRWSQFRVGTTNFALSSPEEGAPAAAGAVIVFEVDDLALATEQIARNGGRLMDSRDMGAHGSVSTFADPDENIFQVFAKAPKPD